VQRIKVNITLEDYDGELPLSAGMSAVVNIDTGRSRTLPWVAQN
jgi:multidrug resistance efflux pump